MKCQRRWCLWLWLHSSGNVKSWKPRFEMFSHGNSGGCDYPLSGIFEGFLDDISINPTEIRFQLIVISVGMLLNMFLNRSGVFFRKNRECLNYSALEGTTLINSGVMLVLDGWIRCPGRIPTGVWMCIIQYRRVPFMWTGEQHMGILI